MKNLHDPDLFVTLLKQAPSEVGRYVVTRGRLMDASIFLTVGGI